MWRSGSWAGMQSSDFLIDLCSYSHLWSLSMGSDCRNEILDKVADISFSLTLAVFWILWDQLMSSHCLQYMEVVYFIAPPCRTPLFPLVSKLINPQKFVFSIFFLLSSSPLVWKSVSLFFLTSSSSLCGIYPHAYFFLCRMEISQNRSQR